jgi:beta-phosphoglucomutase family hydrolase
MPADSDPTPHTATRSGKLALPDGITACLFDLDGVLTETATVHDAAWKQMFDAYLREHDGPGYRPFDPGDDYDRYVDGRPRADGVRTFLASRGIELPEGSPDDPPERDTVNGLGNRKNVIVLERIRKDGVKAFAGSVRFVKAARAAGLRTAVVSSSANCRDVLVSAGIEDLFEVRIDGLVARQRKLPGKPHPDTFLAAAEELGVSAAASAVFEDALAGMEAGRAGKFGYVIGVDRVGQAAALRRHGADTVVKDLAELLPSGEGDGR